MSRSLSLLLGLLLSCLAVPLAPSPARARESAPISSPRATATLVSDTDAIQPGTPFRVGLYLRLAPGWHTYWKNPGDAGVPPELTVQNAQASPIAWPAPRRVAEGPVMTYAYTGSVLLPVTVTAQAGTLKAHASWLVCKDLCVPEEGDFTLDLPAGTPAPSAQAPLFAAHDQAMPRPSPFAATIAPNGTLFLQAPALAKAGIAAASFIPDVAGQIQDDAAQPLSVRDDGLALALTFAKGFDPAKGLSGVLTLQDRAGTRSALLLTAEPGAAPASPPGAAAPVATADPSQPPTGASAAALPRVLLFAFLGGLILNLMPCVFPILAMKAVSLAGGHRERGHSLAYTAGVLVTFIGLAAILLGVRAAGVAAGWGFQFGSPIFVAAMTWLLFAVGLNLSGVFEVAGAFAGIGGGLAGRAGVVGSFFTGLLAVLVATPCTAPFMGVAVAAGLAAPAYVTLLVFAVMGLGLAAPYVTVASVPAIARLLPRPGAWMQLFRQVLAFPMYGAAVWLLWVVSQEAGPAGVLATASGLVLIAFAAWLFGLVQTRRLRARGFAGALALAALLGAIAILPGIAPAALTAPAVTAGTQPFSPEKLAALRQAGRPVFVDMTAAWCVTCLVNERVALDTAAVRDAFARHNVVYMKGDWTRQDPVITAFLRRHGRDGVPLYVYFPPHAPPRVLPQILTERLVLDTLPPG